MLLLSACHMLFSSRCMILQLHGVQDAILAAENVVGEVVPLKVAAGKDEGTINIVAEAQHDECSSAPTITSETKAMSKNEDAASMSHQPASQKAPPQQSEEEKLLASAVCMTRQEAWVKWAAYEVGLVTSDQAWSARRKYSSPQPAVGRYTVLFFQGLWRAGCTLKMQGHTSGLVCVSAGALMRHILIWLDPGACRICVGTIALDLRSQMRDLTGESH